MSRIKKRLALSQEKRRKFIQQRFSRQKIKEKTKQHLVLKIFLGIALLLFSGLFIILHTYDAYLGNIILFSLIFVMTFILVARYHHVQITIILISCLIALFMAALLLEGFEWHNVVDHYMEWEVLAVVFGMSLLVESTAETGLFDWVIIRMLKISKGEVYPLFIMTFLLTLALSTVLANVTAMILISSMIFTLANALDYDPTPFILSAVLATDVAGMATLVSSLPAILVGTTAGIGFIDFLLISLPFVLVSIPICIFYLNRFFPPEKIPLRSLEDTPDVIDREMILSLDPWGVIEEKRRFYLAAFSLGVTIVGFALAQFLSIPLGVVAISGGVIAMILTQSEENRLLSQLNWSTLLFFGGLFILVGVLEETNVLNDLAKWLENISGGDLLLSGILILLITAIFSGVLDNIPVTAALLPIITDMNIIHETTNPRYLWFILVFSGALGGGWTPFGSAAGIVAVSLLAREGKPLNFGQFLRCFIPISALLVVIAGVYLSVLALFFGII